MSLSQVNETRGELPAVSTVDSRQSADYGPAALFAVGCQLSIVDTVAQSGLPQPDRSSGPEAEPHYS
jgi:hypothetical protein